MPQPPEITSGRTHRACIKRGFDIAASTLALTVLAPLIAAIAGLILVRLGRPVLFRQIRPGLNGEPFAIIKFRTMRLQRHDGESDEHRLTTFGRWLRRTSLDELPELVNVLKGEMSLVGPRPLLVEYLPLYSERHRRRHEVRPGITGLSQVNGRNAASWPNQFELDVWYVDNHNLWLDLTILARTCFAVFSGHGVTQPGHATRERFSGYGANARTDDGRPAGASGSCEPSEASRMRDGHS
jgi:sugar transferase EpsL